MLGLERARRFFTPRPTPEERPQEIEEAPIVKKPKRPDLRLVPTPPPEPEKEADDPALWIQRQAAELDKGRQKTEVYDERQLDSLIVMMKGLNAQRAKLEAGAESTNQIVNDAVTALGKAGALKDTVGAMRKAMQERIAAKNQVAEIDEKIQVVEGQMEEAIKLTHTEREQGQRPSILAAEILKGTKMDPRDRAAIKQWLVDPEKEFDPDVYEAMRPSVPKKDLAAVKSNTVPEEMRVVFNREWDEDLHNRTKLEQKRDLLEQDGRERFKKVLGSDLSIENLRVDKSLWGRLLLKARLGKLRGEFANWEQSYDEVSSRIDVLNAKIVQDELWLKNPHQAGVNDVERITGKVLSRQMRTTESLGKGHLST